MSSQAIEINAELQLVPLTIDDASAMTQALRSEKIVSQLATVNWPYTESDARRWITACHAFDRDYGHTTQWSIRWKNQFAGEIGFHSFKPHLRTQASIGFWVAEPFQGQGIAKLCINAILEVGSRDYGFNLVRAAVFNGNDTSLAVLRACGFIPVTLQKNYVQKQNQSIDCWILERTFKQRR